MITQEDVKKYHEHKIALEELKAELDAMRQALIDRAGMGEEIERGPFVLDVDDVTARRVDSKKLIDEVAKVLGPEKAQVLKEAATKVSEYKKIKVTLKG